VAGRGITPQPVHRARGGEILWIDGNLDGYGVAFPHVRIQKRLGGDASCVKCHHMNLPRDKNSGCYECHRDMYLQVDAFRHDWHASPAGGRLACAQCHKPGEARSASNTKHCDGCHKDLIPTGAAITVKQYKAAGYVQAMHELCIGCHKQIAAQEGKPDFARCATCHKDRRTVMDASDTVRQNMIGKGILLPPISK
jgi:hypothetical protein